MKKLQIINELPKKLSERSDEIEQLLEDFATICKPLEINSLYLLADSRTNAIYCECHLLAEIIVNLGTIDVPLDPEEQPEYRANREIEEDHVAYERMQSDALGGRTFSNIVAEYTDNFDPKHPLKIIGGQHRFLAIKEALQKNMNVYHGLKIYFNLDTDQRLDVQLISNTNIAVSSDLLDRMYETVSGPQLRNWCQKVGFLEEGSDFSSRRQKGHAITVRDARTFIMNYYSGCKIDSKEFSNTKTTPILAKSGGVDSDWDSLKTDTPSLWDDKDLEKAGREFVLLGQAQRDYYQNKTSDNTRKAEFAEKVYTFAVISSWPFVAGLLKNNPTRLKRHFNLRMQKNIDPLNAKVLAKAKHKTDPDNYRGLGTRSDTKERGRFVELFYLQAEKGEGIKKAIADTAIKRYHAKKAVIEAKEAEERI